MFIHPAKVCLFCNILVIFLVCSPNFFVNKRCLAFFLLMLICGFLEWMHVWKFVSNAVLIGFEMNIYEHEHILQSCLTVVYLSIYFVEVAVIQSTFDFAQVEANFWLQSVQFCSEEGSVPLFFQQNNSFHRVRQLQFRSSYLCDMMTIQTISKTSWLAGCAPNLQCLAYFLITPHQGAFILSQVLLFTI